MLKVRLQCSLITRNLWRMLRGWFLIGLIVLFFAGIIWQIVSIARAGILSLADSIFRITNIDLYTDKVPFVPGLLVAIILAIVIGALLEWKPTKRVLTSIPLMGKAFTLTTSVIESVKDLRGLPAVLIETYGGLYTLAFVSGFEPIKSWRLIQKGEAATERRKWSLFGVALELTIDRSQKRLRFRLYYPDFPLVINGRMGWAKPKRMEWIMNAVDEILARLASAGFATKLKAGKPISLTKEEWDSLGLDLAELSEEELIEIMEKSKETRSSV